MNVSINQFINNTKLILLGQENKCLECQEIIKPSPAAVLIPITQIDNQFVIIFTKRTGIVNTHQNQISFPGGRIENEDKSPLTASLRETQEEIGICEKDIEILGDLQARNTTTGFLIYPFVGYIHNLIGIRLNPLEVEKMLFIPIDWLKDPVNSHYELYKGKSTKVVQVLFYSEFNGEIVWGITATLVKGLLSLI